MIVRMDTYSCIPCSVRFQTFVKGNATEMAKTVSRGSVGCIAALDKMNPRNNITGTEPWSGVGVKVKWKRLIGMENHLSMKIYHSFDGR